jgi:uncharacterized iron-regulated membrane protein
MAQRPRSTPLLKALHTWTGIIGGLFVSVLGLTGSVIVFRGVFERAALPKPSAGVVAGAATLDDAAREVGRFRPDSQIRRVRFPASAGEPYIFQVESGAKKTERIVADAATGRVTGVLETGSMDWLVDLHRNFLAGKSGRGAVGVAGIVLFLLSASGLLMWFRGARNWRAWITVRPGTSRRLNFELHRASGLWAYSLLTLLSFTGIELAFPDAFHQAMQRVTGEPAKVKTPKPAKAKAKGKTAHSLAEYVQAARAAMPDGVPTELRLADNGKSPVDLRLHRNGDLEPGGNHVYVDPATASVVSIDRIVDRLLGARILGAFTPIHYAQIGGLPIQMLWSAIGLTPALLFVTGLITWWRPTRKRTVTTAPAATEERALVSK